MKYSDGQIARLGDHVKLGEDESGIVVCSIDTEEYGERYSSDIKQHLGSGILVEFKKWGLIHYTEPEQDLMLLSRKPPH